MRAFVWVRGQAAIMLSLSMVVSLGTLGLVTDLGWMYWRKEAAESAAEAAAMAGVMQVSKDIDRLHHHLQLRRGLVQYHCPNLLHQPHQYQ